MRQLVAVIQDVRLIHWSAVGRAYRAQTYPATVNLILLEFASGQEQEAVTGENDFGDSADLIATLIVVYVEIDSM